MITGQITVAERRDTLTYPELKAWVETRAMNVLLGRIDQMIDVERSNCERAESFDKLREAQGALRVLRIAKALPEILLNELRK